MSSLLSSLYYTAFRFSTVDEVINNFDLFVKTCCLRPKDWYANKFEDRYSLSDVYSGPIDQQFVTEIPAKILDYLTMWPRGHPQRSKDWWREHVVSGSIGAGRGEVQDIEYLTLLVVLLLDKNGWHELDIEFIKQLSKFSLISDFAKYRRFVECITNKQATFCIVTQWSISSDSLVGIRLARTIEDIVHYNISCSKLFELGDNYLPQFKLKVMQVQLGINEIIRLLKDGVSDKNYECANWLLDTFHFTHEQRQTIIINLSYVHQFAIDKFHLTSDDLIELFFISRRWAAVIKAHQLVTPAQLASSVAADDAHKLNILIVNYPDLVL